MKCEEMLNKVLTLKKVLESDCTLPGQATLIGARNVRKVLDELKEYIAKKDSLIEKYGVKNERTGIYAINMADEESVQKFQDEIKDYAETEMDFNIQTVPAGIFAGDYPTSVILAFEFMIEG